MSALEQKDRPGKAGEKSQVRPWLINLLGFTIAYAIAKVVPLAIFIALFVAFLIVAANYSKIEGWWSEEPRPWRVGPWSKQEGAPWGWVWLWVTVVLMIGAGVLWWESTRERRMVGATTTTPPGAWVLWAEVEHTERGVKAGARFNTLVECEQGLIVARDRLVRGFEQGKLSRQGWSLTGVQARSVVFEHPGSGRPMTTVLQCLPAGQRPRE